MKSKVSDKYYNIGTGIKTSIAELAKIVSANHPNKVSAVFQPSEREFVKNRVGDTALASHDINFNTTINLNQGLRDFISWRSNKHFGEMM